MVDLQLLLKIAIKQGTMSEMIELNVQRWLSGNYDANTKQVILDLQANNKEALQDAFYRNLEFGTGGLRGIMGVGTNRINKYTIGMATQGFSNYLLKTYPNESIAVAIGHDSRNNSRFLQKPPRRYLLPMELKCFCLKH